MIVRIVLLLVVANPGNDAVKLILNVTQPFVESFLGMFAINRVTADRVTADRGSPDGPRACRAPIGRAWSPGRSDRSAR